MPKSPAESQETTSDLPTVPLGLSPGEREEAERALRAQLEEDHARRQETIEKRRSRKRQTQERRQAARHSELFSIREGVRAQFYEEKGYKVYIDSTGREVWLSPEEYAQRTQRRKRRGDSMPDPTLRDRRFMWLVYGGMVLLAILLGLMLARTR
jgi:hypothetical protein